MSSFRTLQYNRIWMMLHLLRVIPNTLHRAEIEWSNLSNLFCILHLPGIYKKVKYSSYTRVYFYTIHPYHYCIHVSCTCIVWKKCNIDSDSSACVVLVLFWDHFVCSRPVLYMILQPWKSRFLNTFLKWNNMTVCNGYLLLNCMVY